LQHFFFVHIVLLLGDCYVLEGSSLFVGYPRPIRHRGERRRLRERKNPIGLFGLAFNLKVPSATS